MEESVIRAPVYFVRAKPIQQAILICHLLSVQVWSIPDRTHLDALLDETACYQNATACSWKRKPNFLIRK